MRYPNIPEEELKNKVAQDYFSGYDCTKIIGKVGFCVQSPRYPKGELFGGQSLLWAEAKANRHDVIAMFAHLVLTIGKARTFGQYLPPAFLGVFDAEKIAFVAYDKIQHLFFENDFNWNVAPSDHGTKEFAEIRSLIEGILEREKHLYCFGKDDQFLYPKDSWQTDKEFHCDCLAFTLFHGQNRISSKEGTNHWIPFTEEQVNAKEALSSTFMTDFIAGKIKKTNGNGDLFNKPKVENGTKCTFSPEAQAVFDAGRELWRYYHAQKYDVNVNASLYDIREYFQGRNEKGKMNNKSTDEKYNELMRVLREKLSCLAEKTAEKVYEHGFLI